jgi:hypothetical protein
MCVLQKKNGGPGRRLMNPITALWENGVQIHDGACAMPDHENQTKVTILTGSYRIKGYIELIPGARVTDYLTESREFIAVTDAEVWELAIGGRQILAAPFINVSRDHIQIVTPGH